MTEHIVAFVGLPSSGKSTLINSLLGKRILQSGVSRTTTEARIVDTVITDDANNKFKVIDLPGICDSEEQDDKFNTLTYEYILKANLIFWVSDVRNAFITSHEVNEFNKLREYLNKKSVEKIQLYDIGIILSKCNDCVNTNNNTFIEVCEPDEDDDDDEIKELTEDTNISDIIFKAQEKFKDIKIKLFNAFGRIRHHKSSSKTIKQFVEAILFSTPSKENINFDITEYVKTYRKRQDKHVLDIMNNEFPEYVNDVYNDVVYNRIITIYNMLDKQQMKTFIFDKFPVCSTTITKWTFFKFLYYVYKYTNDLFDDKSLYILYLQLQVWFLIRIINTDSYSISVNLVLDYTNNSIELELLKYKKVFAGFIYILFGDILWKPMYNDSCKYMLLNLYKINDDINDFKYIQTILYTAFEKKDTDVVKLIHNWLITKLLNKLHSRTKYGIYIYNVHDELVNFFYDGDVRGYLKNLNILINNKYYILLNKASVYRILYVSPEQHSGWSSITTGEYNKWFSKIPLFYHYYDIKYYKDIKPAVWTAAYGFIINKCRNDGTRFPSPRVPSKKPEHRITKDGRLLHQRTDNVSTSIFGIEHNYRGRDRILNTPEFENLINKGMHNIYDNLMSEVIDIKNIEPLDISEVMGEM